MLNHNIPLGFSLTRSDRNKHVEGEATIQLRDWIGYRIIRLIGCMFTNPTNQQITHFR